MSLTTEFGRIDRAEVIGRAKQFHSWGIPWAECMREAHREAADELRARFNPHRDIQINPEEGA
jgi:hypothetical protein